MLTLTELAEWIREHHTFDLSRVEAQPFYLSASDGGDYERFLRGEDRPTVDKTGFMETLEKATASGRKWRRIRVIHTPMTDYERYSCSWGYPDNVAAGEDVRIVEVPEGDQTHRLVGDSFVVDRRHVARSIYGDDGAFVGAEIQTGTEADTLIGVHALLWERAVPFSSWWETLRARGTRVA